MYLAQLKNSFVEKFHLFTFFQLNTSFLNSIFIIFSNFSVNNFRKAIKSVPIELFAENMVKQSNMVSISFFIFLFSYFYLIVIIFLPLIILLLFQFVVNLMLILLYCLMWHFNENSSIFDTPIIFWLRSRDVQISFPKDWSLRTMSSVIFNIDCFVALQQWLSKLFYGRGGCIGEQIARILHFHKFAD